MAFQGRRRDRKAILNSYTPVAAERTVSDCYQCQVAFLTRSGTKLLSNDFRKSSSSVIAINVMTF
jgi:hypothetical protein